MASNYFSTSSSGSNPGPASFGSNLASFFADPLGPNTNVPTTDLSSYGVNPNSSLLQQAIAGMHAPTNSFTPTAYQAQDESNVDLPEYDAMRQRLNMQYSQGQQQAQDALDRQFSASGGGPGNGAQAKQTENLATSVARQKDQDMLNVQGQEAQERSRLRQTQQAEAFQSGQQVQSIQAQQAAQTQQLEQQQEQFGVGEQNQIANLNTAWDTSSAETANNAFNAELSQFQAQHSGGLLGGGGFLGTGLFS